MSLPSQQQKLALEFVAGKGWQHKAILLAEIAGFERYSPPRAIQLVFPSAVPGLPRVEYRPAISARHLKREIDGTVVMQIGPHEIVQSRRFQLHWNSARALLPRLLHQSFRERSHKNVYFYFGVQWITGFSIANGQIDEDYESAVELLASAIAVGGSMLIADARISCPFEQRVGDLFPFDATTGVVTRGSNDVLNEIWEWMYAAFHSANGMCCSPEDQAN